MIPGLAAAVKAALEREVSAAEAVISAAVSLEGAGCRAVPLAPPGAGRGIVELHEWPRPRLRWRRCYCRRVRS